MTPADLTKKDLGKPVSIRGLAGRVASLPTPGMPHAHFAVTYRNSLGEYTVAHVLNWTEPVR